MVSAMSFVGAEAPEDLHDTTTGVRSTHSLRGLIMIQIDFTNHEILLIAVVAVQFHQNKRTISAWVSWWAVSDWNFLGMLRLNLPTSSNTILSFWDKQMGQYHLPIGFHGTTLNFHKPSKTNQWEFGTSISLWIQPQKKCLPHGLRYQCYKRYHPIMGIQR